MLLPLSGGDGKALEELRRKWVEFLSAPPEDCAAGEQVPSIHDLAFTAAMRRVHQEHRLAVLGGTRAELLEQLQARVSAPGGVGNLAEREIQRPSLVFVFSGQGPQWHAMGRQLFDNEPAYRAEIERCSSLLQPLTGWSLVDELMAGAEHSRLDQTGVAQPALFALQVALAALWRTWGIEPDAVVGHSIGEVAAAVLSGALCLESGIRVVAHRGRVMQKATGLGRMAAIGVSAREADAMIKESGGNTTIAAINSPASVTLSGDTAALAVLVAAAEQRGQFARMLEVNYAFHGATLDPYQGELAAALADLDTLEPRIPAWSTVTGRRASARDFAAAHWAAGIRQPVLFGPAVAAFLDAQRDHPVTFLEIGPHPVLATSLKECFAGRPSPGQVVASLRREQDEVETMLRALGALYEQGYNVAWRALHPTGGRCVSLPTYAWQRERFWIDGSEADGVSISAARASVAGGFWRNYIAAAGSDGAHFWETEMTVSSPASVRDHRVHAAVALPAAGMMSLVVACAEKAFGPGRHAIDSMEVREALVLGDAPRTVQVSLQPTLPGTAEMRFVSRAQNVAGNDVHWTLHALGTVLLGDLPDTSVAKNGTPHSAAGDTGETLAGETFYQEMARRGLNYGPAFQAIVDFRRDSAAIIATLRANSRLKWCSDSDLAVDVLDAALQLLVALAPTPDEAWVPVKIGGFTVRNPIPDGESLKMRASILPVAPAADMVVGKVHLYNAAGLELASFESVTLQRLTGAPGRRIEDWLHEIEWVRAACSNESSATAARTLPAPSDLDPLLVSARARDLEGDAPVKELVPELRLLCGVFVVQAVRRLGWGLREGERVLTADVARRFGVIERHQRLLNRLFEMLTEDGLVRRDGADWLVTRTAPAADPGTSLQVLQARFPACALELTLLGRCAEMLDRVLVGECDPLQLLFPEGSLQSAGRLYQDSSFSRTCNDMVREAVKAMVASVSEGRPLRVLEIGGGTGGTTAHVLPLLPAGQSRYLFTDVSSLFTTRAAEKFRAFPFVEYRVLDISGDPVAQGFPAGEFDLIIAANVLHATPDLRQTLRTTRDLLAPGGELLLVEGTEHSRWIDLIFGLIEGWWLFSDHEVRTSHPLVSRDRWPRVLHECGFAETIAVANATPDQCALFEQAVIVARKPQASKQAASNRWLIFRDNAGVTDSLVKILAARGTEALVVDRGDSWASGPAGFTVRPGEAEDFTRLLAEIARSSAKPLAGIAYLWTLDVSEHTTVENAQQITCDALTYLVQALAGGQSEAASLLHGARLWVVTCGTQPAAGAAVTRPLAAPAWGVGKVIALEHPALGCSLVDLEPELKDITSLADELLAGATAAQVCLRRSGRFEARIARANLEAPTARSRMAIPRHRACRLITQKPGTLDALEYQPVIRQRPGPGEVEIRVAAASVNFRDPLLALGMLSESPIRLGYDAAGVITRVGEGVRRFAPGDEVIAFAPGAFATFANVPEQLAVRRPEGLTVEQGAALPVVFLTAHHALRNLARIKPGDRVLIHAASGGVGMAAVQIALQEGCEVFGTAGNPRKRDVLRTMGVQHVLDSRSLVFADEIDRLTGGRGVDVVLNSLAGDFIAKSFESLAAEGRFIEIGKTGVWSPDRARAVRPNAFYEVFDLIQVGRREPALIRTMFAQLVNEFESGRLKPPPIETYPAERTLEAFRAMSQARHVGKIVITHQVRSSLVEPDSQSRRDEVQLPTGAAFLITGGYGGLGLLLADWLAAQGVRHFVLLGRRAPDLGAKEKIAALERTGATVLCAQGDVASEADVRAVLNAAARSLPPLAGVFHCAGALDDGVLVQMNSARFRTVLAPKVAGAGILDRLTRDLPIQRFVMFSSWASIFGSPGQANHSAANAYLDALAHARRAQGLAGQSINWGPWTQIGAAAAYADPLGSRGVGCFSPREGLTALNMLLKADRVQTAVVPFDVEKWQATAPASSRTRLFEKLRTGKPAAIEASANAAGPARVDIRVQLTAAPGERQRARVMETWLREQAASVLRLPPARVESGKPLKTLGFDSLLAVEFRNRLETSLGLQLPATLIWNYPTIAQLGPHLLERLAVATSPADAPETKPDRDAEPALSAEGSQIEQLSEAEAERRLEEQLRNLEQRF